MERITVRFKKLDPKAALPTYGTEHSAGADLRLLADGDSVTIAPGDTYLAHTGLSLEIPEGVVGLVYARSGLATRCGIAPANKVGVVDSDYRGEIIVSLFNQSSAPQTINNGERIAQMVFTPYLPAIFEEVDDLTPTSRGAGGFGSTGKL